MPDIRKLKFIDSTEDIKKCLENDTTHKRKRLKLTKYQIDTMESQFIMDSHPSYATKAHLSEKLSIPLRNVQIWFQNKRAKDKDSERNKGNVKNEYCDREYY